jgi:hypothetical protein
LFDKWCGRDARKENDGWLFWRVLAQVATDLLSNDEEEVESRMKIAMSVKEIQLAEMTTGMLDGEQIHILMAEEAQAMGEL